MAFGETAPRARTSRRFRGRILRRPGALGPV